MKQILIILVSLLIPFFSFAQKMSDKQVMEYVMEQHLNGASQMDIAADLLDKGVSIEQLQRVKDKYEKDYKELNKAGKSSSSSSSSNSSFERSRYNNGEFSEELHDFMKYMPRFKKDTTNIFGHDIFRNEDLTFEPNVNVGSLEDYVLGPGDEVFVDIYGVSQNNIEGNISPDGYLAIEEIGLFKLSGLTVKQANAKLNSELGKRYNDSKIVLTVGQTHAIMVNVMGEVEVPGTYTVSAFATVFHALYMAGGVNKIGTLRDIKVYRKNKLITSVDIYDYILNGKLTGNIKLHDNDVIIVGPYDCLVKVEGKVKRPMFYEMKKSENLSDLIEYAGGFAGDAYTRSLRILRKTGRDLTVYNVDNDEMKDFTLFDQDAIQVDSIIQRYSNAVTINGAVFRPGLYQIGEKIKTVGELVNYAEGLTEDAFTARAVLQRLKLDRTLEVIQIDLEGILNGTAKDVYLHNEDVLLIPSLAELKYNQTMTIHGEVFHPGVYKFAENVTIEDFILLAGGLKESASSIKIDVARRVMDQKATKDNEARAVTYSFELRDGFVVDAEPGFTLQPYDEVYVRRSPGFSVQENIVIDGEVMFAGTYTLAKQNYRLSDALREAGGTTAMSNVAGARLERVVGRNEPYSVGIDLKKALADPGCDDDIVLHAGDKIFVPKFVNTVTISGQVLHPNSVGYLSGKPASYYIEQAGGYTESARRSKGYIVYQNGKVSELRKGAKPAPGCEIIIPEKAPRNRMSNAAQWVTISTSVATVAALLINALK